MKKSQNIMKVVVAMEFESFPVVRNSKYTEQKDQNNYSCFFLLIMIKTKANKQKNKKKLPFLFFKYF